MPTVPIPDTGGGGSGVGADWLVRWLELDLICGGPVPGTASCETLPECGLIVQYEDFVFPPGTVVVGTGTMDFAPGCCDPGGFVTVACCPQPVPTNLTIFFDDEDDTDPDCVREFGTVNMVYDAGAGKWVGHYLQSSRTVTLACVAGAWVLTLYDGIGPPPGGVIEQTSAFTTAACEPFVLGGRLTFCRLRFTITEGSGTVGGSGDTIRVSYIDLDLPLAFVVVGSHFCADLDAGCCGSGPPGHIACRDVALPDVLHATLELLEDCSPSVAGAVDGLTLTLRRCAFVDVGEGGRCVANEPLEGDCCRWAADPVVPDPFGEPYPQLLDPPTVMLLAFQTCCVHPDTRTFLGRGPSCWGHGALAAGSTCQLALGQPGAESAVTVVSLHPFIAYWDKPLGPSSPVNPIACCTGGRVRVWVYQ